MNTRASKLYSKRKKKVYKYVYIYDEYIHIYSRVHIKCLGL